MTKKLLVICGPTATGKTSLAIELAKKFDGELVSADSRQVYKGMDIGTGKEWGEGVKIWGYDLVDPRKDFSVAQYLKFAGRIIEDIEDRNKLPILVGGTGLYIKSVIDGIGTIEIPRNINLRKNLSGKGPDELFEMLAQLDSVRAASMNFSDKKNPRRLIRAIEIAHWKPDAGGRKLENEAGSWNTSILFIGLTAPKEVLNKKIEARVDKRIQGGFEEEIKKLLEDGVSWENQSMDSLGYRQWRKYIEGEKTKKEAVADWKREEKKYAKRQMTWFKKDKRINWFDITGLGYEKKVEFMVKKWYISS